MICTNCGKQVFEDSPITILDLIAEGTTELKDYCFDCGMEELRKRLKGVPFTIEVPHYREYTAQELHGATINYSADLVNFPP